MNGQTADFRDILVVIPNWVGDVVLATPALAALRADFPQARIGYLLRPYVGDVVAGGGWHDREHYWPAEKGVSGWSAHVGLIRELRRTRYDLVLLLTNSFRSALTARLAGIPRRVGYDRDGRGWLLTDRLTPLKHNGIFVPSPVLPYYCALVERVGCGVRDRRVRLGITPEQESAGASLLRHYGLDDGQPYAVINPGAAFGAAKCWLPERFAEVCDRLTHELGYRAVIVGASREAPLMRHIAGVAQRTVICCDEPGTTLGSLKAVMRSAALLVCNDTGPRHYGAAFGVPTVTIFGPTHQEWTDTDYEREIKIQIPVPCGPCQKPVCPLDLRCMKGVTTDLVMEKIHELLRRSRNHESVGDRLRADRMKIGPT